MRSLQFGAYDNMLKNIVGSYMGYIQIHNTDYWEEKSIDNSFLVSEVEDILDIPQVSYVDTRIEGFALASIKNKSKPVAMLGLDPVSESNHLNLDKKIIEGAYLSEDQQGLLVGKELKEILKVSVGDSLVFLSQGYQASFASGIMPIVGVIDLKSPELNKRTVILNKTLAQNFFGLENMATTAVIGFKDDHWEKIEKLVKQKTKGRDLRVINWQQMVPELNKLIAVDKAGGTFVMLILYSIITFGLLGTIIMLTEERSFEYGVLISIGMAKKKLITVAYLETTIMAMAGVILGLIVAFPFALYFNINPINISGQMKEVVENFGFEALIPTSLDPKIAVQQATIVLILVLIVNIYPLLKIKNLEPVKAMKS